MGCGCLCREWFAYYFSVYALSLSCAVFPQATAGEAVGTKSRVVVVDRAALSDFTAKLNHRYNVRGRGRDESL